MGNTASPVARLAQLMDERRRSLGRQSGKTLTWDQVANQAGVHRETLRQIRRGAVAMRDTTKDGIEDALQWGRGSVDAILAGGNPLPEDKDEHEHAPNTRPELEEVPTPEEAERTIREAIAEDPQLGVRMAQMIAHIRRNRTRPKSEEETRPKPAEGEGGNRKETG